MDKRDTYALRRLCLKAAVLAALAYPAEHSAGYACAQLLRLPDIARRVALALESPVGHPDAPLWALQTLKVPGLIRVLDAPQRTQIKGSIEAALTAHGAPPPAGAITALASVEECSGAGTSRVAVVPRGPSEALLVRLGKELLEEV